MSWRSSFSASPSPRLGGDDLDRLAVGQRLREVADAAVVVGRPVALLRLAVEDADGQRRAGEARADVGGDVGAGRAVGKFADCPSGSVTRIAGVRLERGERDDR